MPSPAQNTHTDSDKQPNHTNPSNNRLPLIVGAGSLVMFLILVAAIMMSRSQPTPTPVDTPVPPTTTEQDTSQVIILEPMLITNPDGSSAIELILNPVQPSVEMTTLSVLLSITGDSAQNPGTEAEVELGESMIMDEWTFPISRTEVVGNSLVTKIAALRIATDAYQLSQPVTIATIPLQNTQGMSMLNLVLDQEESKFFDKEATEHRFELGQESITLN